MSKIKATAEIPDLRDTDHHDHNAKKHDQNYENGESILHHATNEALRRNEKQ